MSKKPKNLFELGMQKSLANVTLDDIKDDKEPTSIPVDDIIVKDIVLDTSNIETVKIDKDDIEIIQTNVDDEIAIEKSDEGSDASDASDNEIMYMGDQVDIATNNSPFSMIVYNDKEEKKNFNLYLKIATINKFKKLCEKSGKSQSAMGEYILQVAFDNMIIRKGKIK